MQPWRSGAAWTLTTLVVPVALAMVFSVPASSSTASSGSHSSSPLRLNALKCQDPKSPGPRCLDLVFDRGADPNGIPLNPRWAYQTAGVPAMDARDLCKPIFPSIFSTAVSRACTSQAPTWDAPGLTGPGGFPPGTGGFWSGVICSHGGGPGKGHSNWATATYTGGPIYFEDKSSKWGGDDDYTMNLHTPNGRGSLKGNKQGGFIHLEFDSDETIDNFGTAWWARLQHDVDTLGDNFHGRKLGDRAIVTGLMGIDWVHTPAMESHPVYALAIESAPGDWGFFVRDNGNEGFCSSYDHPVFFAGGTYTFKFNWQPGATGVQFSIGVHDGVSSSFVSNTLLSNGFPGAGIPHIDIVRNDGVYVTFSFPNQALLSLLKPFYDGEIKLHWIGGRPSPAPRSVCTANPKLCTSEEDDPERMSEALLGPLLSPSEKLAMGALLTQPDTRDVRLGPRRMQIRRPRHFPQRRAAVPRNRALFDPQKAQRDRLQLFLICTYLHERIPGFPKACSM